MSDKNVFEKLYEYSKDAVSIPNAGSPTVFQVIDVSGRKTLAFHFSTTGQNISKTRVRFRSHKSAEFQDLTPSSWTVLPPGGFIKGTWVSTTATGAFVDGDLDTVATTENAWFKMDVSGMSDVEIAFNAAVSSAIVSAKWGLQ